MASANVAVLGWLHMQESTGAVLMAARTARLAVALISKGCTPPASVSPCVEKTSCKARYGAVLVHWLATESGAVAASIMLATEKQSGVTGARRFRSADVKPGLVEQIDAVLSSAQAAQKFAVDTLAGGPLISGITHADSNTTSRNTPRIDGNLVFIIPPLQSFLKASLDSYHLLSFLYSTTSFKLFRSLLRTKNRKDSFWLFDNIIFNFIQQSLLFGKLTLTQPWLQLLQTSFLILLLPLS